MTRSSTRPLRATSGEQSPVWPVAASRYWIRKLQACVYAGDGASAVAAASKAAPLLWTVPTQFELAEYHFYAALARAARCDTASAEERPRHLEALAAHHRQIAVWAENCPATFANRAALVGAEIARLEGRELDAMRLYEEAIRSAREHGFVQNEGLANELAARFYAARGFETIAHAYLRNARHCYLRWGAEARCGSSTSSIRICARNRSLLAHRHLRRARRAAGCRDGGQGFAGGVGRDRPRQAHRDADDDRARACRRRAGTAHPSQGRRAADRGGGDRPAAARSRSRCARRP